MYKKVFAQNQGNNKYQIHLCDDDGYQIINSTNKAYIECSPQEAT